MQDLYTRVRDEHEVLRKPNDYASLFGIDEGLAKFNLRYLVERDLVAGKVILGQNTTITQTVVV